MEFKWSDYRKAMSDRIHMAGENIEMSAYIYSRVLEEYARVLDTS
ncbi:MAG TPA: hypothetical protein PLV59_00930 [Candidatus Dojkabacteria bacterium]|nr:hypothetical protein [Candidatus Dojkabacteria bacterium]